METSISLSVLYFPVAVALGALHALEPGHAKTLTAAYLIGIKGTKRDALLLGLSVAASHSLVVIAIALGALWAGREAFTDAATHWLQLGSGAVVVVLGAWLFVRRWRVMRRVAALRQGHAERASDGDFNRDSDSDMKRVHHHEHHDHDHHHDGHHRHDHDLMTDEEHARAHAATLPDYVAQQHRPRVGRLSPLARPAA